MIFKVTFSPSLKSAKQNVYISFCGSRLNASRAELHMFLYKCLFDKKLIDVHPNRFSLERGLTPSAIIKCYVAKEKSKLFCTLHQLVKPPTPAEALLSAKQRLMDLINAQSVREIQEQEDAAIFAHLDMNIEQEQPRLPATYRHITFPEPRPGNFIPVRPSLDYMGIARRALIVEELPAGALPVYDRDIDAVVLDDE